MKKIILGSLVGLTLAAGGQANAVDYPCTTGARNPEDKGSCYECSLSWFNSSIKCRYWDPIGFVAVGSKISKSIDDCVGNDDGQMVHGLGAGDSCKDYNLDNDLLTAKCRNVAGVYVDTSISVPDFFAAGDSPAGSLGTTTVVCVQ